MIRVTWISNAPAPYKVAFMDELGKHCELTCLFEMKAEEDRHPEWYDYSRKNFRAVYLSEGNAWRTVAEQARRDDVLINSDYSKPICQYAVLQFHLHKKKTILHADGGLAIPRGFMDKIISWVMKRNDYVLSSGAETDRYFAYYGLSEKRIRHYRFACASDAELKDNRIASEAREALRKEAGYTENRILLGIGQPIPRKGFDVLIKAMAYVPEDTGLYIIGGEPSAEVAALAEPYGGRVHFLPFMSKQELVKYYAGADLFVLPTRYDIWGLVINEAMSFGLPCVSTDHCVAALHFINTYDNGSIVPIEDEQALGKALRTLLEDDVRRNECAEHSRKGIEAYSYENMARDFLQVLEEVSR